MKIKKIIKLLILILVLVFIIYWVYGGDIKNLSKDDVLYKQNLSKDNESGYIGTNFNIKSEAAIVIEADDGKILFAKNENRKMFPASITKLMTALLLAEKMNKQDILTYDRRAKEQEANKLDFQVGVTMSVENAMQGMLVFSANDIAYMIGENISGTIAKFARLMNEKASRLGLKNTHFVNSCGLHDNDHYTTARDLGILAREIYQNKWIMNVLGMESAHVKATDGKGMIVYNTNKLLGKNGCIGGKTGYTARAGKCLVAYYKKDNRVVIGIVLNAPNDLALSEDMRKIVDWSLRNKNS